MCQPYIESATVLSDIYIYTDNPTTLPCSLVRAGNNPDGLSQQSCVYPTMNALHSVLMHKNEYFVPTLV